MHDPAEIARKLSKAQKTFVAEMPSNCWEGHKPFLAAQGLQLVERRQTNMGHHLEWSPLGQAVAAYLKEQECE